MARARPHFVLFSESKFCSVEVINLDAPCIKVHNIPSDIPGYKHGNVMTTEYCDGLLVYVTGAGYGICNPWLKHIRWIKPKLFTCRYNGMGYDYSRPDNHYKIYGSYSNYPIMKGNFTELGSNAWKLFEVVHDTWGLTSSRCSVSLNGTLYWVGFSNKTRKYFIQSFDFSIESLKPYCTIPGKNYLRDVITLAVFKGDRFSILEQDCKTRNMEIWVTKKKIKNGDGEGVEWMKFMNVTVPTWSSLVVYDYTPSYYIDEKSHSLVFCSVNAKDNTCIYIAKGDKFHEIEIKDLVGYKTRHHTYFPCLVPVPNDDVNQHVGSYFALPKGREANDGAGEHEWDDGFFDSVKKISVGRSHLGLVFVRFEYSNDNVVVAGAAHGDDSSYTQDDDLMIDEDNYIEAVEGTYTESHITSLKFCLHKCNTSRQYGRQNGTLFVLGGGESSKIIGFYGRNSDVHDLTALGVHLS
ncbi:hypothetical protein CARUB_v10017195mg, partial [Capsella rubella]